MDWCPDCSSDTKSIRRVYKKFGMPVPIKCNNEWHSEEPATPPINIYGAGVDIKFHDPIPALNPNDPFESAIIEIVEMNRRKRRDYAVDSDPFSNFKSTSSHIGIPGFGPTEAALFNVVQKLARLESLRTNGRMEDPANESVEDTYLDLAVYAVITYAIYKSKSESGEQ